MAFNAVTGKGDPPLILIQAPDAQTYGGEHTVKTAPPVQDFTDETTGLAGFFSDASASAGKSVLDPETNNAGAAQAAYLAAKEKGAAPPPELMYDGNGNPVPSQYSPTVPGTPAAPAPGYLPDVSKGPVEELVPVQKGNSIVLGSPADAAAQQLASGGGGGGVGMGGGGGGLGGRIVGKNPWDYGQTPTEIAQHGNVYNHMLAQRDFGVAEAANQAQLASQQADAQANAASEYYQLLQAQKKREAERQMWVQSALDKHEQMANELSAQQIDPDRFFTSKGVAGGIMAGIGMAMSGVADAVLMASGAPGAARFMDRAMGMIDRDIAVQKANIQLKRDAFGAQMGVYAERYKAFGDERVAEASARASIFDWLAVQMKAYQAQAFERTTAMAVGQIAEDLSFRADAYKNGITIASEHAYDEAVAKQQAAYWNAVAAARKDALDWQKYQRKTLWDNNMEIAKHAGMENGGLIGQMPSGHPLAGMPNMIMQDAQGNIVNQLPGNPVVGTGGMNPGNVFGLPPGVKPGSKDADKWEARTVGARINGQEVNIVARSEGHAMKLAPALGEAENYINALKQMKTALKDIHSLDGWKLYEGAFNNAGGGYKQIYNLGAYDLGVQNLVAGSLPSQSLAFVRPEAAAKMIDQQLHNAELIRQTAIASWARHGTVGQIAQATGGSDYSSLGAVKVDDPTTPGSWLGAAAGARFMGGPGAIAGYYLGK